MLLNDKVYKTLKWLCLIGLPASSVFYAALDGAFNWGRLEVVCTVIAALETFIGSLIGISTKEYNNGKQS